MDENENIVIPNLIDEEERIEETSLRPRTLKEYIGQDKVKESMKDCLTFFDCVFCCFRFCRFRVYM